MLLLFGFYLLCRDIMLYTLCLTWSPRTVKEGRSIKTNYERKREVEIKTKGHGLTERDI